MSVGVCVSVGVWVRVCGTENEVNLRFPSQRCKNPPDALRPRAACQNEAIRRDNSFFRDWNNVFTMIFFISNFEFWILYAAGHWYSRNVWSSREVVYHSLRSASVVVWSFYALCRIEKNNTNQIVWQIWLQNDWFIFTLERNQMEMMELAKQANVKLMRKIYGFLCLALQTTSKHNNKDGKFTSKAWQRQWKSTEKKGFAAASFLPQHVCAFSRPVFMRANCVWGT